MKYGKGASTSVYLRCHTSAEYTNLIHIQRSELKAWHITPEVCAAMKALKAQRSGNKNNYSPINRTGEQLKLFAGAFETALAKKAKAKHLV